MTSNTLLDGMNPEQSQVVCHRGGPLVVAAGAGCGKTKVLTHRVASLVDEGADPTRILAVTFSVKAAKEMNARLVALDCSGARVGTFHSLSLQIVREELPEYRQWAVDDSERYRICVKDAVSYRYMKWQSADVTHLLNYIGRCKAAGARPDDADALVIAIELYKRRPAPGREPRLCRQAYEMAELVRRERQILTFDDMLVEAWELLRSDDNVRQRWAAKWDHVLQDECFVGETPVLLADGSTKPIRDLVTEKYAGEVLTWSPATGTVARKVTDWARKPVNRRMVRVAVRQIGTRENGVRLGAKTEAVRFNVRYLVCTEDHPVWTQNRGWCAAGQLQAFEDVVQVETVAPWVSSYANRVKHSSAGRERLRLEMTQKNQLGMCGARQLAPASFSERGGNGRGPSPSEAALLERLGDGWIYNLAVPTGRSSKNGPTHYKVDLANPKLMLAIELDGSSHSLPGRLEQDAKKERFLRENGWEVIRMTNRESWRVTDELLHELVARCPVPGQVLQVEEWTPRDPFVYDITIDETHAFYADGVLVHNCQDENFVQHEIAAMLARDHRSYMIVGDPAQSIYKFRGANPQAMLAFEVDWAASVIRMGRNYRSGDRIVEIANRSLAAMPSHTHLGVQMIPERGESGEVSAVVYADLDAEGEGVTERLLESHEDGRAWGDHVVLFRTNAQSRCVEEACLSARVPYRVIGGTNFYDRREVKDLLAYLRVGEGRGSFDEIRRSINTPFRYLGKAFIDGLEHVVSAGRGDLDLIDIVRAYAVGPGRLQQRQRTSALEYCELIAAIGRAITTGRDAPAETAEHTASLPARILENLVSDLRYAEWLTRDSGMESPENNRVSNVRELIRAASRFRQVSELLDYVDDTLARAARAKRESGNGDVVTLCSIHRSKGLEWPVVFVLGCNEKILPHAMAEDVDEERRLFYVACTRARDVLQLSCIAEAAVSNRVLGLEPSRFLHEVGLEVEPAAEPSSRGQLLLQEIA